MTVTAANLGFPRIGPRRELKTATEAYWAGKIDQAELLDTAKSLRAATWDRQKAAGIDVIPSNDFSFYDQVLDTSVMLGAIPAIYAGAGASDSLDLYFAMARGRQTKGAQDGAVETGCVHGSNAGDDVPAQEMTKWFDTNYHYMVPEVTPDQAFALSTTKPIDQFKEAKALGHHTRPVILGPITWLLLAKSKTEGFDPLTLLPRLLPIYGDLLSMLAAAGADWVQVDEPILECPLPDVVGEPEAKGEVGRLPCLERCLDFVRQLGLRIEDELDLLTCVLLEGGDDLPYRLVLLRVEPLFPPHHEIGGAGAERRQRERRGENNDLPAHNRASLFRHRPDAACL